MYQKKALAMYYCITPVHMGAGTGLGVVDSPIQRENHTSYPVFPGSGIKGALRDHLNDGSNGEPEWIRSVFGAEDPGEGAGALSFTDAVLVAFPARSLKNAFVYLCSPVSIARLIRQLGFAEIEHDLKVPNVAAGQALTASESAWLSQDGGSGEQSNVVVAESFSFNAQQSEGVKKVAEWLSSRLQDANGGTNFFGDKVKTDLVMVSDSDFEYFITSTTSVEAHIRIDDKTGTAAEGALFYIENLPPESILSGVVLASGERRKNSSRSADEMLRLVTEGIEKNPTVQFGGDATTGRGLVQMSILSEDSRSVRERVPEGGENAR